VKQPDAHPCPIVPLGAGDLDDPHNPGWPEFVAARQRFLDALAPAQHARGDNQGGNPRQFAG